MEICRSDFKCFNVKFYVSALVDVIIRVVLRNARSNDKDTVVVFANSKSFRRCSVIHIL